VAAGCCAGAVVPGLLPEPLPEDCDDPQAGGWAVPEAGGVAVPDVGGVADADDAVCGHPEGCFAEMVGV